MDQFFFSALATPRRALVLASGAALLSVVAPGLAQSGLPVSASARMSVAPAANAKLAPVPFKAPTPRSIKVSKIDAANAFPYVNRAAKQLAAGNTAAALALYRQAYQLDPTNEYAAPGVGTSLIIQGKFNDAAKTFFNHLVTNPDDPKTLRGLADALTYAKQYRDALGVNDYILSRDSRDFASLYQNAQIATYAGDYKLSETYFNRASGVKQSDPEFWTSWGESLSYRRNPRALNAFNRALQLRPNDTRATQDIADYYVYTSQFDKAVAPLQTVVAREPNNAEALVSLGNALSYSGQSSDAVSYYQKALELQPNDGAARLGLGRALVFAGRKGEGATELRRVLTAQPGNREALEALALAQNSTAPNQAIDTYRKLLATTKDDAKRAKILASIGDLQLNARDLGAASQSYRQASELAPRDADINLSYAQILGYNDDYAAAGPVVERVLQVAPSNPRALALQVQVASKTGDSARAAQLAANLRGITPANAQDALALADALRDAGDNQAANALLVRASTLSSDPAVGLRIANATRDGGDYAGSVELYNRLLRADPNDVPARVNLARALYYDSEFDEATNQIDQVLQLDAQNQDALLVRAELLLAGNTEQGRAQANTIAQGLLANGNNAAAANIAGEVLTSQQQFGDAITQFRSALQIDPNNLQAQLGLARNLYYARQVDDSIAEYQKLITEAPADTLPRLELAQIFLDRNRFSEAEQLFNEVLTLQQRGVAAIPAARRASERGELARLNPQSLRDSFIKDKPLAQLSAATANQSQALKIITLASAQVKPKSDANGDANAGAKSGANPGASAGANADADANAGAEVGANATGDIAEAKDAHEAANVAKAQVRLAQSASPTIGVGGNVGSGAPPAATFPGGPTAPAPNPPADGAPADGAPGFVPTAPLPPAGAPKGRPVTPRVPTGAGETPVFTTPLAPGATANSSVSDRVKAYSGLGEVRLRQQRYAEALELFSQALQLDANAVVPRVGAARALRGQSNFTGALNEIERALTVEPSNLQARVLRAQLLSDTGQPQAAQAELDSLLQSLPADAPLDTLLTLVEALNSLRNYDSSLQLLNVATELYPREPAPLRLKAETLNFAGRYDESLTIYDQLIAADAQDGDAILGKARVYNYSNRLPQAEATYRQVLAAQPENYQAATELADVLGRRGNYTDSIQLYALAIQGNPTDLASRVELARVQRYAGRQPDAEATLTQVLDADPRNVSALTERGILRGVQGSYDPAIADLQQALQIAPQNPTAQLGLAEVQGYAGQYPESIAGYRAVLQRDPKNDKARTELGQVLGYSGDNAAAITELDAVLANNPTDITTRLAKADVLGRSDRTGDAVKIYNDVLTADPRNERARSGLANTYVVGRRYADAIKIYDQLIVDEPTNSTYKIARARALGYNRQFVPASESLRAIIADEPDNLTARLAFADVGTNSGDASLRQGAIAEYRRLIAADGSNVPARVGLARALSYQGQTGEASSQLNSVLAANPNNNEARLALGEAERFGGKPFDARDSYKRVLATDPGNAAAKAGLDSTYRLTRPSIGVSGSFYNDTNGVRLKSVNFGPTLRTRAGVISIIAEEGRFKQGPFETRRSNIGVSLGKAFGPIQAVAAFSRLKYDGAPERFLYDVSLLNSTVQRRRYFLGTGRRDVYESAQAVVQGITATTYRGGFSVPVSSKLDFETQAVYYNYSDNNSRYSILPALYYRLRPTTPSLRLGVGYAYDDSRRASNIYYAPRNYSAFSGLADYQNTLGKTRYGFNAAVPFTNSTGAGGVNRPADTLFGFVSRDIGKSLELFANGGIVRSPDFKSDTVTFGGNLWF